MNTLVVKDNLFSYRLVQEERKTLAAHVMPNGDIIVKAPNQAKFEEIEGFIKRKANWIMSQIGYFEQFNRSKVIDYSSGSEIFYLGKQYQLIVEKAALREYVELDKSKIIIYSLLPKNKERIKKILDTWVLDQTSKELGLALKRCIKKFPNVPLPTLKIRKLSKRWGSYIQPNTVIINPELILMPKKCIDYVICHELCHYFYKNHSAAFYSLLGSKVPNWLKLKKELEENYKVYVL